MKKLLLIPMLLLGLYSCSSSENGDENPISPITNVEVPKSSAENPIKTGESVTIKGEGFIKSSEIWLRAITKSNDDVKAEVTEVTSTGISFIAPKVSGERGIILKQSGQEQVIGKMYFEDEDKPEPITKKRIVKHNLNLNGENAIYTYSYKENRLESMIESQKGGETNIYKFEFNDNGQLTSTTMTDKESNTLLHSKTFEYKDAKTILAKEIYTDDPEGNGTMILTLDDNGWLIKQTDNFQYRETYTYDALGNITEAIETYFGDSEDSSTYNFKYDDKNAYLSNQGLPQWYRVYDTNDNSTPFAGPNNMIEKSNKGYESYADKYKYDYDDDGYPTIIYDSKTNEKLGEFTYEIIK